jgi:three-Cys-motif partner protein
MNKRGNIEKHSKLKLNIYKKYLETYLSIMGKVNFFESIFIVEPFAGKGIADNGEKGSALIAKEVISSIKDDYEKEKKSVFLRLNEKEKKSCDKLKENLGLPLPDISVSNGDANKFIVNTLEETKDKQDHKFFFIDPWGYTQLKEETYQKIFKAEHLDLLIFIPIYSIYRFLRKKEDAEQLKPIADFLRDIGINEADFEKKDAKKPLNLIGFANEIKRALSKKAYSEYVYYKMLKNQHALFFMSKNILGAEKFLEVLDRINEKDLFEDEPFIKAFIKAIRNKKELTNCELYKYGILNSLLPKKVRIVLKELEANNKINVMPVGDCKNRRKGNFYNYYKYYNKKLCKLKVTFIK